MMICHPHAHFQIAASQAMTGMHCCGWLVAALILGAEAAPLTSSKLPSEDMENFMKKYGYLKTGSGPTDALYTKEGFNMAVQQMQKFGGLPQTGELDEATVNLTRIPRCGVPDVVAQGSRRKRYVIGSKPWKKRTITYFLANWPPELDPEVTKSKLAKALDLWSASSSLRFVPASPQQNMDADLIIAFGRGYHGDDYPFDGPGNVLAHAFFPYEHDALGGDIHFDDDEHWIDGTVDSKDDGVDFYTVAAHEIGHSLGLAHSAVAGSIMFPYYKGYDPNMRLDYDDVYAMYSMYVLNSNLEDESANIGNRDDPREPDEDDRRRPPEVPPHWPPDVDGESGEDGAATEFAGQTSPTSGYDSTDYYYTSRSPHSEADYTYEYSSERRERVTEAHPGGVDSSGTITTTAPKTREVDISLPADICSGSFDAASLLRNELFVFKGQFMWRFRDANERIPGYPVDLHDLFTGMPRSIESIDAVYQRPNDYNIVFFTGQLYWIFDGNRISSSPRPLTDYGLPRELDKVDAVFVWAKNGKTYFFRKDQYWRYDDTEGKMESGYPQRITRWRGIAPNIDTAFTWLNGKTYFFKDDYFWRFNNKNLSVDGNYPQPISGHWFGC